VIISQDMLVALSICDRIALIENGKVIRTGTPFSIAKERDILVQTGLDYLPYLELIKPFITNN